MIAIIAVLVAFTFGVAIGYVIMCIREQKVLDAMLKQCAELNEKEERLTKEREDLIKTKSMLDTIDDVPEYLRDKYYLSEQTRMHEFTDSDEDIAEIYC